MKRIVAEGLRVLQQRLGVCLIGYVIMPEHVHLLIYPRAEGYSISRILSTLKQPVSKRAILFVQGQSAGVSA